MLFLFRGRYGPMVKAAVGVVLLVAGLLVHGGVILVVIGAVLIAWGAASGLQDLRARRRDGSEDGSR